MSVNIILAFQLQFHVVHIPGSDNTVADALSRFCYNVITSLTPHVILSPFELCWGMTGYDF